VASLLFPAYFLTMNSEAKQFLFDLLNASSPTGFETEGQKVWMTRVGRFADSVENDTYGTAWAVKNGLASDLKIMVAAHADEIGFMVHYISDEGFVYVERMGGMDRTIARGKRVRILGDKGPVQGVIGNTAIHLRDKDSDKVPEIHDLFVDVGAKSREEAAGFGLRVGHPAVYVDSAEELIPGRLIGRALDNRINGFVLTQVLEKIVALDEKPTATVQLVNAAQEEIGGAGATMIAYRLEPNFALVLDVTHATDSPGIDKNRHGGVKLGEGPSVTHGTSNHPLLVKRLISIAEEFQIPIQHESSSRGTGTDTDSVFQSKSGIPSALISIPMRYMHSTIEMVDFRDVERVVDLVTQFILSVKSAKEFKTKIV
jgi:putative aminopeptidase FrvX